MGQASDVLQEPWCIKSTQNPDGGTGFEQLDAGVNIEVGHGQIVPLWGLDHVLRRKAEIPYMGKHTVERVGLRHGRVDRTQMQTLRPYRDDHLLITIGLGACPAGRTAQVVALAVAPPAHLAGAVPAK